jgi:hypothetical protein
VTVRPWLALLLLVALVAAAPRVRLTDPEALLRAGDDAFRGNDPAGAADLYDRAGVRTIEPARAAFNLATAKYRLARDGRLDALGDAEVAYRCCLEKGDPYRARALLGLGNCLLLRAASGTTLDRGTLRAAIDRYSGCLADPGCTPDLAADARHNRVRARLLLLQAPPPPPGTSPEDGNSDDQKQPDNDPDMRDNSADEGGNEPGKGTPRPAQGSPGGNGPERNGARTDGTTGPGQVGKLPPVQDDGTSAPISARDAAEHVEQAARKILDDLASYRRGKARPAAPGVRDW